MTYIIAHRGASHVAPENTASAFRKAIEMGADGIETDVQVTADHQLVIHHNYVVDGTSNGSGHICNMTLEELKKLDFGSYKGEEFAGEQILTLDECLDVVRPLKYVNIELKAPADRNVPYVKMVVDAIREHDMVEQTVISSFAHDLLREVKKLCPELRVGALTMAPGLAQHPLFGMLEKSIPADTPLEKLTAEDLKLPAEALADGKQFDIIANNPTDVILEMVRGCAVLLPAGAALKDAAEWLKKQEDLVSYVEGLDFKLDYLHPEYHSVLLKKEMVAQLAEKGIGVSPYTPDKPEELDVLWNLGCYGIITNRPDILLHTK